VPFSGTRLNDDLRGVACVEYFTVPIYLNKLDRIWAARCSQLGILIRYCDDFVAMCQTESQAREALRRIGLVMSWLGLTLHPTKTRLVDLRRGKESFVFLGCTIRKRRSIQRNPRWHFMQRWPSPKAMKKLRDRVHELTSARQSGKDVKQVIAELTLVIRGWGNSSTCAVPSYIADRRVELGASCPVARPVDIATGADAAARSSPSCGTPDRQFPSGNHFFPTRLHTVRYLP
jgi:reverse transcriptase-like protein/group II intron maturase